MYARSITKEPLKHNDLSAEQKERLALLYLHVREVLMCSTGRPMTVLCDRHQFPFDFDVFQILVLMYKKLGWRDVFIVDRSEGSFCGIMFL